MRGTFEDTGIRTLIEAGRLGAGTTYDPEDHVQPASVDVTFDGSIYQVSTALMPKKSEEISDILRLANAVQHDPSLPLCVGTTYMAKASISLNLSPGMHCIANPKSTLGRLFGNTRIVGSYVPAFDCFDKRHKGLTTDLWLVIEPMCFDILPSYVERYAQLRISNARKPFSNEDLLEMLETNDILYDPDTGEPYPQKKLSLFTHDGSVRMTLSAQGAEPIGYKAKRKKPGDEDAPRPVNLEARDIDPHEYFEPVYAEQLVPGDDTSWGVWLEANEYYLLSTHEVLSIPKEYCLALAPMDPHLGEVVVHYAGFVDCGWFGRITLEVCSPRRIFLRHKSPIATGVFSRMRRRPKKPYVGSYQGQQRVKLPKQFLPYIL